MTLNLYVSLLNKDCEEELLKTFKNRDLTKKHIVIAPQNKTLNIEKKLFSFTNSKCLFNIEVSSFSSFIENYLKGDGFNLEILSRNSTVAIIKKILSDNKFKLTNFKKAIEFNGFCNELYNLISSFKSNKILPKDILEQNVNSALDIKIKELKFIYEKYEEVLGNKYIDAFDALNIFENKIASESFSDYVFYFIGFDEFTQQQLDIISDLIKISSGVSISTTWSNAFTGIENSNIFVDKAFNSIIEISEKINVEANIIKCGQIHNEVESNLFSLNVDKNFANTDDMQLTSCGYTIYSYSNILDEVKRTVADIKYKIINEKLRFQDFAIIVPSFSDYKDLLKKEFNKFELQYYFDATEPLINTYIARQFLNILQLLKGNVDKYKLFEFLKSIFSAENEDVVCEFEKYVLRYGIQGDNLFNCNRFKFNSLEKIYKYHKELAYKNNVSDMIDTLKDFLREINFEQKLKFYLSGILQSNNIMLYKQSKFVVDNISKVFKEINTVFGYENFSFDKFIDIFETHIENIDVTLPPLLLDAVFVGEFERSYLESRKFLYILGANEGSMPSYSLDTGIITDNDISILFNNKNISTVAFKNKLKRFKTFENLFLCENTIISFKRASLSGEDCYMSIWLEQVAKILKLKIIDGSKMCDYIQTSSMLIDKQNFIFNNFNQNTAKENFLNAIKQWETFSSNKNFVKLISTLNEALTKKSGYTKFVLSNNCFQNKYKPLKNAKNLFFKTGKVNISEIERYYHCPYQHFVDYCLGLEENKLSEITAMDNGNILHEFLKIVLPKVIANFNDDEFYKNTSQIASDIISSIIEHNANYEYIKRNPLLNYFVDSLKDEAGRILRALIYQQKHSKFVSDEKLCEYAFEKDNEKIEFELVNKKIVVKGFIDRVDIFEDGFRIIDYKTGKSSATFKDFSDLYNGKKIQLFIYLMAFEKTSKKKPLGAFYMPIVNVFSKGNCFDIYKLQGIMDNSISTAIACDDMLTLPEKESLIIEAKTDKNGVLKTTNKMLSQKEMHILSDYAFNLLKIACENILLGDISAKPLGKDYATCNCSYCNYKAICGFNELYGNSIKDEVKVSNFDEFAILEGEING